jgi:hypothetical protein
MTVAPMMPTARYNIAGSRRIAALGTKPAATAPHGGATSSS